MAASGLRKFAEKFDDELKFFKGWIDKPKSGRLHRSHKFRDGEAHGLDHRHEIRTCRCSRSDPAPASSPRRSCSHGVKPSDLYAVEYSHDFVTHLRRNYPGVNVIEGDGFDLDETLGDRSGMIFDSVVSGVPLLNFPVQRRVAYLENLLSRIPHGRPVVQLTYGPKSPIPPGLGDYTVEHFHFILRNIPPTQLWLYRRAARN